MYEQITAFDFHLFLFLNSLHTPLFDTIMAVVSAKMTWVPLYLGIVAFIFWKYKWKTGLLSLLAMVLLLVLTDQTSVKLFKEVFERLRPCHQPRISHLVHIVDGHCGGKFGFVSSHAANTFGFAAFTATFFRARKFTWFIFLWAIIVSYSRIYLGVHYPSDIVGGAILGMFWGFFVYIFYNKFEDKYLTNNRKSLF
ncbi:MAG: phosphatase PAP2 family protein [Bacteroidales bacterium]|nr:phosphatase PAP2 family protein [Bacteroidales bacterium]